MLITQKLPQGSIYPQITEAPIALGRVNNGQQQWEKAIASDSEFDNAVSHFNLGEQLFKCGAVTDAFPHLRRAYGLDPQNATYRTDYETVRQRLGSAQ